jgi:hypothetical protein
MELYDRIEQIISELRPAFSRETTFQWFVLLLWGTLLSTQSPAVTTYLTMVRTDLERHRTVLEELFVVGMGFNQSLVKA